MGKILLHLTHNKNKQVQSLSRKFIPKGTVQSRITGIPLLLTSSAQIPPAPAWLISYSIANSWINLDCSDHMWQNMRSPTNWYVWINYCLTSKNIPNSVSGIFRDDCGEASTLRVAACVATSSDARHLQPRQNRSKRQKIVADDTSLKPIGFPCKN